ncbi:MAG: SDR family NAD(P)-dependent oxidoreductase [Sphingobium sp.]|nr:SDR family NAD(P)-dependent oxidoreductase [Sphingobium sp.]MBP6111665.1 SDR family NAD(P)-dependent oxidoreductase [Sphingobium sp.]MBP8670761.1 SDR family NAD(P)-dependent oxidoreductase [Sphingobium sp.]MBP9157765.1 SDR family NAD(P)-dependent oxidoreductase [Sphingobium sp.]MCC6482484.1 SDR family NAD(P)-dependent oxidoreductase [Sphingomonadaceae bacterium]
MMAPHGTAFVTGCSSGIGAAFARALARKGHDLVIVARRADRLRALAAQLEEETGRSVSIAAADLSEPDDLAGLVRRLTEIEDLALLVNNAGLGPLGDFADLAIGDVRRMLAVNIGALTELSLAAVPQLIRNSASLINVASGVSFAVMKDLAVYSGTKGYVMQFTRSLALELEPYGCRVQALVPGLTRTDLGGAEAINFFDQFPPEMVMEPEDLVAASLAGLALNETVCIPALEDARRIAALIQEMQDIGMAVSRRAIASRYRPLTA